jgi:hypothetical protein
MPCYQSTTLPGGVTTTGRTAYRTEAECVNACREGACCEGTTCTVKPQCQCQGDDKRFQGIGTVCTPNLCLCCNPDGRPKQTPACATVSPCWCLCGEGSAPYPRFVNISLSFKYDVYRVVSQFPTVIQSKEKSVSGAAVTLTSTGGGDRDNCPVWVAGNASFGVITQPIPLGVSGAEGAFSIGIGEDASTGLLRWSFGGAFHDFSERPPWSTAIEVFTSDGRTLRDAAYLLSGSGSAGGPYTSGACYSNMSSYQASAQGVLRDLSITINGVQA